MATLTFGENATPKTADDYILEIQELLEVSCPVGVLVGNDGKLLQVTAETTWKEGETTPIKEEVDGEIIVTGYEQNYENKSLTQAQITKLNTYMQENITQ